MRSARRARPLVRAVAAFSVGILAGFRVGTAGAPPRFAIAALGCLVAMLGLGALILEVRRRPAATPRSTPRFGDATPLRSAVLTPLRTAAVTPARHGAGVLVLFLGAGMAHAGAVRHALGAHPLAGLADGARIQASGSLEAIPGPDGMAWFVVDSLRAVAAPGVSGGAGWVRAPTRIRFRADEPRNLSISRTLLADGTWRRAAPRGSLPRRVARAGWLDVESLSDRGRTSPLRSRLRGAAQRRLRAWLGRRAPAAEAMVLARRETLSRDARERFAAAGLSHLLAISGLHVAVIAGCALTLAGAARVRRRTATGVAGLAVVAYVALLGFPHAASRAAVQICLLLAARGLQRPADPYSLLAAAALALLVADPLALTEPGFQMSFAGVAGLVAWRPPIEAGLARVRPRGVRSAIAASVAATLATAPIAAWTFGQAAPIGLLANLIAIPLTGLAVPALAATLVAGAAWAPAGAFLGGAAGVVLAALDEVAAMAAGVPGGHGAVPRPAAVGLGGALVAAAVTDAVLRRSERRIGRRARRAAAAGAATAVLLGAQPASSALGPAELEIHAIDVGQGDALALRTPRGRWMLVDAGPRSAHFDAGAATVVPYLLRQGAGELDALILTHPDGDHIGGAAAVVEALSPSVVLDPAAETGKTQYVATLAAASASNLRWARARAGARLALDGVALEVLAPDSASLAGSGGANDISVVARVEFGRFRMLLMGDAPAEVEERLVARDPEALAADLLKVGHHGSHTSTSAALLRASRPRFAVIPVGRRNRYGHPHEEVVARLRSAGATVLRTDTDGHIVLRARRDGSVAWERH